MNYEISPQIKQTDQESFSVIVCCQETFEAVVERRMMNKLLSVMDNQDHPVHYTLDRERGVFSRRLTQLRCLKELQEILLTQSHHIEQLISPL